MIPPKMLYTSIELQYFNRHITLLRVIDRKTINLYMCARRALHVDWFLNVHFPISTIHIYTNISIRTDYTPNGS